jgi:hypothetical protein
MRKIDYPEMDLETGELLGKVPRWTQNYFIRLPKDITTFAAFVDVILCGKVAPTKTSKDRKRYGVLVKLGLE